MTAVEILWAAAAGATREQWIGLAQSVAAALLVTLVVVVPFIVYLEKNK